MFLLDHGENTLGFTFPETGIGGGADAEGGFPSGPVTAVGLVSLVGLTLAAVGFYRSVGRGGDVLPPPLPGLSLMDDKLRGLGGWLVLVAIGLFARPIVLAAAIIQSWPSFNSASWRLLTEPGSGSYHALWAPYILGSLFANLALLAAAVLCLGFFFEKRRIFPTLFICCLWAGVLVIVLDSVLANHITGAKSSGSEFRGVLTVAVWTAYMVKSRRVRLTFTR